MSSEAERPHQHRVRRRHGKRRPVAEESPTPASVPVRRTPTPEPDHAHHHGGRDAERGMRALIGAGPSQLSREVTMRTRDANRPTAEELAEAERDTQVVRRNWQPRAES